MRNIEELLRIKENIELTKEEERTLIKAFQDSINEKVDDRNKNFALNYTNRIFRKLYYSIKPRIDYLIFNKFKNEFKEELDAEAMLTLRNVLIKFDLENFDNRLYSYAYSFFYKAISDYLLVKKNIIRQPSTLKENIKLYNKCKDDYIKEFNCSPSTEDMVILTGLGLNTIIDINNSFAKNIDIYDHVDDNVNRTYEEVIPSYNVDFIDELEAKNVENIIEDSINNKLTEKERLTYIYYRRKKYSLRQIGEIMNTSITTSHENLNRAYNKIASVLVQHGYEKELSQLNLKFTIKK